MVVEDQGVIVKNWIGAWNEQDSAALRALLTDDYLRHDANLPEVSGAQNAVDFIRGVWSSFPDLHLTLEQCIVQDQDVRMRWASCSNWALSPTPEGSGQQATDGGVHPLDD